MFCEQCGNKISKQAVFCSKCGAKVSGNKEEEIAENDDFDESIRYTKKGFKCLDMENNDKAYRCFSKAMAILPNGYACYGLACCHSRTGDYGEALDLFIEAIELFEEQGDRDSIRQCNDAIKDIQETMKQRDENREGLFKLGVDIISNLLS